MLKQGAGLLKNQKHRLIMNEKYLKTYYEIVESITLAMQFDTDTVVHQVYATQGRGGLYELAKQWANEFHSLYADCVWDGDVITDFFNSKNELT